VFQNLPDDSSREVILPEKEGRFGNRFVTSCPAAVITFNGREKFNRNHASPQPHATAAAGLMLDIAVCSSDPGSAPAALAVLPLVQNINPERPACIIQ
jgi:hypothetical protein